MGSIIDSVRNFKLFSHKEGTTSRDFNDQLFRLKEFVKHPYWSSMQDMFDEETRTLTSQLMNCTNNDDRNIVIGQLKELKRIVNITEAKAGKPYLEETE